MTLILKCEDVNQHIGVAKKDVFFLAANKSFFQNFLKAYIGIWFQLLVVVSLGVMFSTFLSSITSLLATICALILGQYSEFLRELAAGRLEGGGPLESLYRIVRQRKMTGALEGGFMAQVVETIDLIILFLVSCLSYVMPSYDKISFFNFISDGYNIEWERLLIGGVLCFSFCFVATVIGYFSLKTREIAG